MIRFLLLIFAVLLVSVLVFFFFFANFTIPTAPPSTDRVIPFQRAPLEIGSYDIFGEVVSRTEAEHLLQTEAGRHMLSREQGAIEITEELITLGREAFYLETFGNEYFLTDIVGVVDGPLNFASVTRAILSLGGSHTTNLQVTISEDLSIGNRTWREGEVINTGLDVPAGYLLPLGMRVRVVQGEMKVGVTCSLCHSAVEPNTGAIIEGATNIDVDVGLILALASNSAAMFRHTDINPMELPQGERSIINSAGERVFLPDPAALEQAVDEALLAWPPGTFDATADLELNPTFIGPSFTFGQFPYGWNGFGSVGWFQGLTTLNNNVHAVSADNSTDAVIMGLMLEGIDEEIYLGILLQNAASDRFRLPEGSRPSEFFQEVAPHPTHPGVIEVVEMPGYPETSVFAPSGLVASRFGLPFAEDLNAMSAFQHTLAPPSNSPTDDMAALERGAEVFIQAGCQDCHSGRFFSNNRVIPQSVIGTQPSRALALQDMAELLGNNLVYTPDNNAPIIPGTGAVELPISELQRENLRLAYALDGEGGYKVVTLIGVYLHAPYLHDAGVAAGPNALRREGDRYVVADQNQMGVAGTLVRGIRPDPAASLRVLVDRQLRAAAVAANHANPDLVRANVEGIGHEFWVDQEAGFNLQQQDDLILFLLSLDDNPPVRP
jgi:hypothetical protein